MKSINYILSRIVAGSLAVGLVACDLEEYNPGGNTADTVWSTEQGFKTIVNGAYHYQRNFYGKEDAIFMTEAGTDLWFNANRASYANQLTRYEGFTPDASGTMNNSFRTFYTAISHANEGINRIGEVPFSSPEERARREGELRFLRGFYYWHVVETWGGINLKLDTEPGFTAERSSVQAFYDVIIADLEFAAANLPNQNFWAAEYSRASKKSALGFLAKALLSRAYYSEGAEREQYFARARDVANDIINRKGELGIDLYPRFAENFATANLLNARNHKEAMYIISNSNNQSLNFDLNSNRLHLWHMTQYGNKPALQQTLEYGQDNQRRLMPTLALLDFYEADELDTRYQASFQEVWLANANNNFTLTAPIVALLRKDPSLTGRVIRTGAGGTPRDTAMVITRRRLTGERFMPYVAIDRDSVYATESNNAIKSGADFVRLKKFHDPNRVTPTTQAGFNDIILMRFAEIYLIAAEAEHQLGNNQRAAELINVIRTRAAVPGREAEMQIGPERISIDFILDERARELAGEHTRWFDLKRTRTLVDRIARYNPDITAVREFHMLRPVPQGEIDALLNGDEFAQNPGYVQ
ncbi:RagB/SusD family nutrient uptake outer membrane protein [Pontibacter beigongshangensis]|uniref:RagB/SusD family nutrient uptake outer membrane protein n=1 Tax=Pontibacter beigongshangensis TaxID=2574733 RepID=UPI00164FB7B4|nr:RagB/SusD family nutrient uptake outer membrane protein [Pontibacter beigongshangensis]